jgi:hypothetical protein
MVLHILAAILVGTALTAGLAIAAALIAEHERIEAERYRAHMARNHAIRNIIAIRNATLRTMLSIVATHRRPPSS